MKLKPKTLEDLKTSEYPSLDDIKDWKMLRLIKFEVCDFVSKVNEIVTDFKEQQPLDEEQLSCITVWLFQKLADINNFEHLT
jgi:hypothetical protein